MPKFIIERDIPGVGQIPPTDMKGIATKSNDVLHTMQHDGTDIQWVQSYVTGDKMYCVYNAPGADAVREHAQRGGFPANRIEEVKEVIDPTTGE
ncbi:MAG TPA: DUF4242 domain-containing protein [Gemmatimonadaceae bacterium]|jgi:hypothetical protein|nr:DUF4242 domain-containing protein [Gemmatimonadaceae bacterium]